MTGLFVFTAGNKEARQHWTTTISNAVPEELILENFPASEHGRLKRVAEEAGGFHAWGAVPGPRNIESWERMSRGDGIIGGFGGSYRAVATILDKFNNEKAATALWGRDDEGLTWQLMYFLTAPQIASRRYEEVSDFLHERYFGLTRISGDRIRNIESTYGSIEN